MATAENPFTREQREHAELITNTPVDRDELINSLDLLESVGNTQIGAKALKIVEFASAMHEIYGVALELPVEPPLTPDHRNELTGKMAGHAILANSETDDKKSTPTDTSRSKTSGRKA